MRQVLVLFHRYVGLALAGFLIMAGLTGAVLAFQRELDATLNPHLFRVESGGAHLPLEALRERVEARLPEAAVVSIQPPWEADGSALVRVEPAAPGADLAYDEVYANPVSGAVLGKRLWGACCLERENLIPFLFKLHYTLHAPGQVGLYLMGVVALLWSIDCIAALVLSAPRGGRKLQGWGRALSIKPRAAFERRTLDLHRAPGLWLWIVLLVTAVTGVGLNLRDQVFEPVVSSFFPVSPPFFERPVPPGASPDILSFDQAVARARAQAAANDRPGTAAYVLHAPALHAYGVALTRYKDGDPRRGFGPDWYYIDARDGSVRASELAGRGAAGDLVMQSRYPLHTGLVFGLAGQLIICAAGLLTATLSVTGVLLWAAKRRARLRARDKRRRLS
ncbi:MAG TPA: PepSY-associated TM helix domain-containing protein [Caulobacter sp.]|nr:PepSY-associated TM helix domain-containing protein [Caulobacter sp.]